MYKSVQLKKKIPAAFLTSRLEKRQVEREDVHLFPFQVSFSHLFHLLSFSVFVQEESGRQAARVASFLFGERLCLGSRLKVCRAHTELSRLGVLQSTPISCSGLFAGPTLSHVLQLAPLVYTVGSVN